MITAEEVVRSLPMLLKEHPELRAELFGILSEEFVGRREFYVFMKKSDERFEQLLQELRAFREDTNRRFEASDKKFEEHREDMNRRFEASDKKFEEHREDTNRRFEAVDKRFDKVDSKFNDLKDWVGIVVGGFQRRAGRSLEDAVAGTLRIALDKDVKPENITMRKKIKDDEGMIGPKGRSYEIDLCLTNTESLIFEIKSYAEEEDIERFNDKAELVKKKLGLKKVVKVLITLEKHPSVVKQCDKLGILVG
ncbi:hypothetical protein C5S53_15110 [Methanophagales archaeon]|jgi:hypothetical protein|nr:hypothetical protein C5S53_15110 [Methanophagales archaeon]